MSSNCICILCFQICCLTSILAYLNRTSGPLGCCVWTRSCVSVGRRSSWRAGQTHENRVCGKSARSHQHCSWSLVTSKSLFFFFNKIMQHQTAQLFLRLTCSLLSSTSPVSHNRWDSPLCHVYYLRVCHLKTQKMTSMNPQKTVNMFDISEKILSGAFLPVGWILFCCIFPPQAHQVIPNH